MKQGKQDMEIYSLPQLDHLKLRFHLTAQTNCNLPPWKGSLIRGAFGHALRRTVCTLLRTGTSVGSNYRAACQAKSTADFIL